MADYARRVLDDELDELMQSLAAISIEGPKGVGKTATARRRSTTIYELDNDQQVKLLESNHSALHNAPPGTVLIDEWQHLPGVWDRVRRRVDDGAPAGRFLLTGSATPTTAPTHSGAGRIVTVRMRPMTLFERGITRPTVSLRNLLSGAQPPIEGESEVTLGDYADEIVRSGFPGIRAQSGRSARNQLDGYIDRIVEHDFAEQGHVVRRPATLLAWLRAYAAASSTTASYNTILDAATPGDDDKPAKTTTIAYRDVLTQLWLLDPIPGWIPLDNAFARLAQSPKHHLADPAIAARLLGLDAETLLRGREESPSFSRTEPFLGHLFESLVALDVRVYAQAAEARVSHLRTQNADREIDLILEGKAGRVLALEVKLTPSVGDRDVRHLLWLRDRIGDRLLDAAVITTGSYAYRRQDGIAVIPAALLGP